MRTDMQRYLELISDAALRALKQSFRITHRKPENTADPVYLSHMLLNHLVNQGNIWESQRWDFIKQLVFRVQHRMPQPPNHWWYSTPPKICVFCPGHQMQPTTTTHSLALRGILLFRVTLFYHLRLTQLIPFFLLGKYFQSHGIQSCQIQ